MTVQSYARNEGNVSKIITSVPCARLYLIECLSCIRALRKQRICDKESRGNAIKRERLINIQKN